MFNKNKWYVSKIIISDGTRHLQENDIEKYIYIPTYWKALENFMQRIFVAEFMIST